MHACLQGTVTSLCTWGADLLVATGTQGRSLNPYDRYSGTAPTRYVPDPMIKVRSEAKRSERRTNERGRTRRGRQAGRIDVKIALLPTSPNPSLPFTPMCVCVM